MERRNVVTILCLVASLVLELIAVIGENHMALPIGVLFLILAGLNSVNQDEKAI